MSTVTGRSVPERQKGGGCVHDDIGPVRGPDEHLGNTRLASRINQVLILSYQRPDLAFLSFSK